MKGFIQWLRSSAEGVDGKSSGRALTAYALTILITINTFAIIAFVIYALLRTSLISENEMTSAHYLIESLNAELLAMLALWGVTTAGNVISQKILNPPPASPTTNVNVQSEKTNINQPAG